MNELTYEEYEKLVKKYEITKKTHSNVVKKKIINFIFEVYKIGDFSLFSSRIIDNFFENGDRIANATKEAIKENMNFCQVKKIASDFGLKF